MILHHLSLHAGHDHSNLSVLSVPFSLVHKRLYKTPSEQRERTSTFVIFFNLTDTMSLIKTKGKPSYHIHNAQVMTVYMGQLQMSTNAVSACLPSAIHLIRHPGNISCDWAVGFWNLVSGCKKHRGRAVLPKAESKHFGESLLTPV